MSSISKIHFSSTTGVSLNDRFTVMAKMAEPGVVVRGGGGGGGPALQLGERPRARSNSLSRSSDANRQLVSQWDSQWRPHTGLQKALQLNNASSIRSGRQRLQRNNAQTQLKRTLGSIPGGFQRMQRSNSFGDIATMNADRIELQQRFRNKGNTIAARLGQARAAASRNLPRGRSRTRSVSRGRSASRTRSVSRNRQPSLSRSNSQTNLRRAGSRSNLSRSNSRNRLNTTAGGAGGIRQRLNRNKLTLAERIGTRSNGPVAANTRGRSRSRSRVRGAATIAAAAPAGTSSRSRSRKRAGSRVTARAGSVNSRLGANRTAEPIGRVASGRIAKRSGSRRRRGVQPAAAVTGNGGGAAGARTGRPLKRGPAKRKGAPANDKKAANGSAAAAAAAGGARRGRSRSRRANSRVRGRSASKGRGTQAAKQQKQPKSKEELDSELDQYMANTKSCLDREMDEYMNGISAH
ncbi:serine/arginine-rich splicing factor 4-like [Anopheles aquasalis]|uniref:serine/arginine-rich splicing factor 4-like n=1 Tax=Anopheles aquasalis TaxID=42839 RepID=UPI00215A699A|nr:serine/arginine-rich splicing factor 4-like [Anopheles aquasalis]XP_050085242.1 serine/arginine-rich splicing factor 4-like [Anopheles aquasalis]